MNISDAPVDKRMLILDAAENVLLRRGYSSTTVDAIAEEAGVAKGTIYLYFPSKQELFASLLEERGATFAKDLAKRLSRAANLEELLLSLAQTRAEFFADHSSLLNLLFHSAEQFPEEVKRRLFRGKFMTLSLVAEAFARLLPEGFEIKPEKLALMVEGAVDGVVMHCLHKNCPIDPQMVSREVKRVFLPGLTRTA